MQVRLATEQEYEAIGQLTAALKKTGQLYNTLIILTSDNGPVLDDGYADGAETDLNGHTPAGPLRGGKYSHYEGGTRLPFIVHWPQRVKPGVSDALVSQVDLLASLAALTGTEVTARDSQNVLPALLGEAKTGRASLVEQGQGLALREGQWKYVSRTGELYDLSRDLGETKNLASAEPERAARMKATLASISGQ